MSALDNSETRVALWQAWTESQPGTAEAHEEGGFILMEADGKLSVERWPRGVQDAIEFSGYASGMFRGRPIVGTFHTHPNPAPAYRQEPSRTDIRAVCTDEDLHGPLYEGELVIARDSIYLIQPDGQVRILGHTMDVLQAGDAPKSSGG